MAEDHDFVFCATKWAGMSADDIPNAVSVLQDLSGFPTLADRLQQGVLNTLFLGRLMIAPGGLASNPAFQNERHARSIDTVAPLLRRQQPGRDHGRRDHRRGARLHARGARRAGHELLAAAAARADWDTYARWCMTRPTPTELERPLALGLMQMLWDRGEADGYAQHMTTNPLPDTPAAHGADARRVRRPPGARTYQADVRGAHDRRLASRPPILARAARSQRAPLSWGIPRDRRRPVRRLRDRLLGQRARRAWPRRRSRTCRNRELEDPHEYPRRTPAARQQKSDFLKQDGTVTDPCGGLPCVAAPDVG